MKLVRDANRKTILQVIAAIRCETLAGAPGTMVIGFFYYWGTARSGRPTRPDDLIPIEKRQALTARISGMNSVQLNSITQRCRTERASLQIVVFDACRNELKFRADKSTLLKGFAPVAEQTGMLIAFATAPGRRASDEGAAAGPYATILGEELLRPGTPVEAVIKKLSRGRWPDGATVDKSRGFRMGLSGKYTSRSRHGAADEPPQRTQSLADLVEDLKGTVVTVEARATMKKPDLQEGVLKDFFDDFFKNSNRSTTAMSKGLGFVIDPSGLIITTRRVVAGSDEIVAR